MYIQGVPLPTGAKIVGYASHPRDKRPDSKLFEGAVVRLTSGIYTMTYGDGSFRSVPQDWAWKIEAKSAE